MKFKIKNRFSDKVQITAEIDCVVDDLLSIKMGLAVKWAIKQEEDLRVANLRDANLSGANLCTVNFRGADLTDANLSKADLSEADFRDANLSGANFCDANLNNANFRDADLSDANLSGANLRKADFRSANLNNANLRGAHFSGAYLRGAYFCGADLSYADLSDAHLNGADLSDVNLSGAYLSNADLRLFKADLWMTLTQNKNEVLGLVLAMQEGRIDGSVYSGECACLKGTLANIKGVSVEHFEKDASQPAEQWFLMINKGDKPTDNSGGGFALKTALEWTAEWCVLDFLKCNFSPIKK